MPIPSACAQENAKANDDFESRLLSMKNPFKARLPEKEIIDENSDIKEKISKPIEPDPKKSEVPIGPPKPIESIELMDPPPEAIDAEPEEIIPLPDVIVSGIIWNSDRPQAIINEQIVNIGDTILGIEITEIRKTGIDGLFHGRTVTIGETATTKTQRSQL